MKPILRLICEYYGTDYSRNMEDFVTWVDSSKIKRNIMKYRDKLDDFDLL